MYFIAEHKASSVVLEACSCVRLQQPNLTLGSHLVQMICHSTCSYSIFLTWHFLYIYLSRSGRNCLTRVAGKLLLQNTRLNESRDSLVFTVTIFSGCMRWVRILGGSEIFSLDQNVQSQNKWARNVKNLRLSSSGSMFYSACTPLWRR